MDNRIIPPNEVEIVQPKRGAWQTYDITDGLPGGVECLLQGQQGYLWLGTKAGLCRYDGTEFATYTTADGLADNWVRIICEEGQERLWLASGMSVLSEGRGVSCVVYPEEQRNGQRFTTYTADKGLAHNDVIAICADHQGRLWFGTKEGVTCFDGQNFTTYTIADGLADNYVHVICEDRQGRLWFGAGDPLSTNWRGVTCFDGQNFTTYTTTDGLVHNDVMDICADHQGRLWFGTKEGVACFDEQNFTTYTIADGLADNWVAVISEDRQGRLWFGTWGSGVCCFDGQRFLTYTTEDGLLTNRVDGIIQDGEGIFWFAHALNGLTRFDPEILQFLTDEPVSKILIQDKQERLWFSNERELCSLDLSRPDSRETTSSSGCLYDGQLRRQTFNARIYSLLEDTRGRFWVGTQGDGLYCYASADGVWESADGAQRHPEQRGKRFTKEDGLESNYAQSLLEAKDGTIWVGTGYPAGYLCRFDGKAFLAIPTPHPTICPWHRD